MCKALQDEYVLTNRQASAHRKKKPQSQGLALVNRDAIIEKNIFSLDIEQAVEQARNGQHYANRNPYEGGLT